MDTSKQILKIVSDKIYYERNDNLLNHFKTFFQSDPVNYNGFCKNNTFALWQYSPWSRLFYPVVYGQIITENEHTNVVLTTRMNSLALVFTTIVFFGFFFGFCDFNRDTITIRNIIEGLIFASLPTLAILLGYSQQKRRALANIKEILKKYVSH